MLVVPPAVVTSVFPASVVRPNIVSNHAQPSPPVAVSSPPVVPTPPGEVFTEKFYIERFTLARHLRNIHNWNTTTEDNYEVLFEINSKKTIFRLLLRVRVPSL